MRIWFFHHYATPLSMSGMQRPALFSKKLVDAGHTCEVFASSYLHYSSEQMICDGKKHKELCEDGVKYHFLKCGGYRKSGIARIINMLTYAFRVRGFSVRYSKNAHPDVIIASSPHPFTMLAGIFAARKIGVPCICEIRDFWPEVIFMSGRIKRDSIIGNILLLAERYIYERADALIFLKELDTDYLDRVGLSHCKEKSFYINNGIDISLFEEQKENVSDFPEERFTVTYAGSVRPVNDIDSLLDCAKLVKDKDILFLIYGSGNMTEHIASRIEDEKIENVRYMGCVPKKNLPYILSHSSLLLMNYTTEKYNWSYGSSSNKLFEYFAAGRPVLSNIKTGADLVDKYSCGISLESATPDSMAEAVVKIKNLPPYEYEKMCTNAREASADFDYTILTEKLCDVINFAKEKEEKRL